MSAHTAENEVLRWRVVGDLFGRDVLLAAFVTKEDADDYAAWRKDVRVRVVPPVMPADDPWPGDPV